MGGGRGRGDTIPREWPPAELRIAAAVVPNFTTSPAAGNGDRPAATVLDCCLRK